MKHNKNLYRFLNRKLVKNVLGSNYKLSEKQKLRMYKLFDKYGTPKDMENMLKTVAFFVKFDLSNYVGRYRRLLGVSGTSQYTQMLRYGRNWKIIYQDQSKSKIQHFKNVTDYWVNHGYTIGEAHEKVKHIQSCRAALSAAKTRGTSLYTVRSAEYWVNNGYTIGEAHEKVKQIQTTNGLEYYKKKYPNNFEHMFAERIAKWQESLIENNDITELNLKKSHSVVAYQSRGMSYEDALNAYNKQVEHLRHIRKIPSKISQRMCNLLERALAGQCYYSDLNREYCIDGVYVDFYHKDTKTVVEFYGDFYHRNPNLFESVYTAHGISSSEKWEYDAKRQSKLNKSNLVNNLIIVWESDFRKNPVETVNTIKKEII